MNYPRTILFTGDADKKLEGILLNKMSHNLQAEILKIGHHGSRFSTSDEFLNAVQPQTALISVGKSNMYGHPARETVAKLEDKKVRTYRTDTDGRVEILLQN